MRNDIQTSYRLDTTPNEAWRAWFNDPRFRALKGFGGTRDTAIADLRWSWVDAVNETLGADDYNGLGVDTADSMWERGLSVEQAAAEERSRQDTILEDCRLAMEAQDWLDAEWFARQRARY